MGPAKGGEGWDGGSSAVTTGEAIDHALREEKSPLIQNLGEQILGGVRGGKPRDFAVFAGKE
jgi:hypothetical protein